MKKYRVETKNGVFLGVIEGKRAFSKWFEDRQKYNTYTKKEDCVLVEVKESHAKTYTIYDNYDVCSKENMECVKEDLLERIFEGEDSITLTDEYGKEVEVTQEEYAKVKLTEEKLYDECYEQNRFWFEDERENLSSVDDCGELIAIADVGTWRGTFSGYKKIKSLPDVLYSSCDYERVYVDSNGDLRKEESHHDGSNSILYRYFKDNLTEEQKDNFLDKIYSGECTQKDITRYTRKAGVGIAKVYGWKVRGVAC